MKTRSVRTRADLVDQLRGERVVAIEAVNGGFTKGEDDRLQTLLDAHGHAACGGRDAHLVSFVGLCATEFERDVRSIDDLVAELRAGRCRPVDFRRRAARDERRPRAGTS